MDIEEPMDDSSHTVELGISQPENQEDDAIFATSISLAENLDQVDVSESAIEEFAVSKGPQDVRIIRNKDSTVNLESVPEDSDPVDETDSPPSLTKETSILGILHHLQVPLVQNHLSKRKMLVILSTIQMLKFRSKSHIRKHKLESHLHRLNLSHLRKKKTVLLNHHPNHQQGRPEAMQQRS